MTYMLEKKEKKDERFKDWVDGIWWEISFIYSLVCNYFEWKSQ